MIPRVRAILPTLLAIHTMKELKELAQRIEQVRVNSRLPAYQQAELTEIRVALQQLAQRTHSEVDAEIINTEKEFKWRLKKGREVSRWSTHYAGVLVHRFSNGEFWALATDYWAGSLPVETPFQLCIFDEKFISNWAE